jgi:predicted N-acyltransferase
LDLQQFWNGKDKTREHMSEEHANHIRWINGMAQVDREQWDRLALPLESALMEWQWLHELEASGSISPEYGWSPCHLTLWQDRQLIAAAPLYVKTHSEGEFIFDHWWAQLAREYSIPYYPKMVGMSPATPSVGYRFLMADGVDQPAVLKRMLTAIDDYCIDRKISCCHLNFVDLPWFSRWESNGFTGWRHQSYLWENQNYGTFEDYLNTFKSSQKRNIRRERRRMETYGIDIKTHTGKQIPTAMADTMFHYYLKTNAQYGPWAARYLNGDFFNRIFKNYRHRMLIIAAYKAPSVLPIALSMLLFKNRHLIGRYWGCEQPIKDLHFNMCFYAPIQWAIENNFQTFDPGAGSTHKIYRGFKAVANTSLHRFYQPRLKMLFQHLIDEINRKETNNIDALNRRLPFAKKN